jgi:hypothetical protein
MVSKKVMTDLQAVRRECDFAAGVRRWQRESIKNRCSLKKLAEKLGCTVPRVKRALEAPRQRLRRASEKLVVVKELRKRYRKPQVRDSSVKLANDVGVTQIALRTVQTMRAPYRKRVMERKRQHRQANLVDPSQHDEISEQASRSQQEDLAFFVARARR